MGACSNLAACGVATGGESIQVARRPRDGDKMVGMTVERLPLRVIQSAIDGLWRVT